jgi:hypothetical protein
MAESGVHKRLSVILGSDSVNVFYFNEELNFGVGSDPAVGSEFRFQLL